MEKYLLLLLVTFSCRVFSCDTFVYFNEEKESIELALSGDPYDCPSPSEREVLIMKRNFCQRHLKEMRLKIHHDEKRSSDANLMKACLRNTKSHAMENWNSNYWQNWPTQTSQRAINFGHEKLESIKLYPVSSYRFFVIHIPNDDCFSIADGITGITELSGDSG